jgi:probable phosphoglycerate mutase
MGDDLILHFVRHGETTYNAERRIQGQMHEVPLSDLGREQARETADALAGALAAAPSATDATQIIASDLLRAMETARIIGARLDLPVTPEPALRERHFGVLQDRLYEEFDAGTRALWWSDMGARFEGGESWADVYDRVAAFLDGLRASPPAREIILVAHGGTVNVGLTYLAGKPVDEMVFERLENCAVRTVAMPPG